MPSVRINGVHRNIRFRSMKSGGSKFITDDKAIIKALDNHPQNGRDFRVWRDEMPKEDVNVSNETHNENVHEAINTNEIETILGGSDNQENESNENAHEVFGIKTFPEARQWLMREANVPHQRLNGNNAILRQVELAGVSFPDLTAETE